MMCRARFSIASSYFGRMRLPQKTWNPEGRRIESRKIISLEIFPLAMSIRKTVCRNIAFSLFQLQGWGYPEHPFCVKAAVRDEYMAMEVEAEKVAEGLNGDNCTG